MDFIGKTYDQALADPENDTFLRDKFIGMDEYNEKRIMTSFKPRAINADDELFIVFVKPNHGTVIFTLDEVYEKTIQYLVHAEDIAEFVFDEKDKDLIWSAEPVLGKDLMR